jgi:hypothetical protein
MVKFLLIGKQIIYHYIYKFSHYLMIILFKVLILYAIIINNKFKQRDQDVKIANN